jgi:hypothetical protein
MIVLCFFVCAKLLFYLCSMWCLCQYPMRTHYSAEVFVYTGPRGERVPHDVVRVRVDPSVTPIPAQAFYARKGLAEVELCEGLVEIGKSSFERCDHSITKIKFPISLRSINDWAFYRSLRCPIRLHMALKVLEIVHSLAASSPTLGSHHSLPKFSVACYTIVNPCSLWSFQTP